MCCEILVHKSNKNKFLFFKHETFLYYIDIIN